MDGTNAALPASKGTYSLIVHMSEPAQLTIGRLGTFAFGGGWYVYVGSALGSGGLRARLGHHLSPAPRPRWHIDYLRMAASVQEVWYIVNETTYEHRWASGWLSMPGAEVTVPRFGASDCTCAAHLIHFRAQPSLDAFRKMVGCDLMCYEVSQQMSS
ncbi:MAG: GIY-YIG nuclease family protein [Anaerolineae bacterium]|nr:GIY-YIG nuclease family protein [Anaerolineae bacterium]